MTCECPVWSGEPAGVLPEAAAVHPGRLREVSVLEHSEPPAVSGTDKHSEILKDDRSAEQF